jgi:hypothetical protein
LASSSIHFRHLLLAFLCLFLYTYSLFVLFPYHSSPFMRLPCPSFFLSLLWRV